MFFKLLNGCNFNSDSLTDEQNQVLTTANAGHNLLITGKAGTGKSFVVNAIVKSLRKRSRRVVIVCSSGISCTVHESKTSTVHSEYALQTADMPSEMVVQRSLSTRHALQRVATADTIILDEAGTKCVIVVTVNK